jgi:hypothetical protein
MENKMGNKAFNNTEVRNEMNDELRTRMDMIISSTKIVTQTSQALSEIRKYITGNDILLSVLDHIEINCEPFSYKQSNSSSNSGSIEDQKLITLSDFLCTVWNKIDAIGMTDEDFRIFLRERLLQELTDCKIGDEFVCTTGKIRRMLNIFNGFDGENLHTSMYNASSSSGSMNGQPEQVNNLNEEMMAKASKISSDILLTFSQKAKYLINTYSGLNEIPEEASICISLYEMKTKRIIRSTFKNDYVNGGILSQTQLDSLISSWIDSI